MSSLPEPRILKFTRWLAEHRGLHFDPTTIEGYDAMWRWSVNDLEAFWGSVWDHFDIQSPTPHARVLAEPGGATDKIIVLRRKFLRPRAFQ